MASAQQISALAAVNCEVAFDNLTRQLYATDASIHQVEPTGSPLFRAVPSRRARHHPGPRARRAFPSFRRGAGTGLAGGAIGEGLVIDFSRYNKQISDIDLQNRTAAWARAWCST